MSLMIQDYWEAEFKVFPLWGVNSKGACECGNPECKALFKHPKISSWTHTPHWSEEQIQVVIDYQCSTGFGVCCDGYLIVDVDKRNDGFAGLDKLNADLGMDLETESEFVIATGGGGLHIYFRVDPVTALMAHHADYQGIDFKSSGFVVGAGSMHASGDEYSRKKGFPQDVGICPPSLIELLRKKEHKRVEYDGEFVDLTEKDVSELLSFCDGYNDYDSWVSIGMAVHHATDGGGFDLWDKWSQSGDSYDPAEMGRKWHSFGKCANPVTVGTLIHNAEQGGYQQSVTFDELPPDFVASFTSYQDEDPSQLPFDTSNIDLKRPPGFVGKLTEWMNGNSWDDPLESLNVITALTAVGNIIGLHTTCDVSGVSTNLITLCVAESSAGKETVQQSFSKIMRAAGMAGAIAGDIKSKQEIVRNLIEHQSCYYLIDELGEILTVIENAKKRGGAAYLEGTTGLIMGAFTKASSYMPVTGDTRRELVKELQKELSQCEKKQEENQDKNGRYERRSKQLEEMIPTIMAKGLPSPFLSLIGYSVPQSMEVIMTESMAKNGFLSRALLAIEHEDNPKPRMDAKGPQELPDAYVMTIKGLAATGITRDEYDRIEYYGKRIKIKSTEEAREQMNNLRIWQSEYAELHRETTGFTPVIRRFWETVGKISLILAAPERIRTIEHVKWAAAFVKRDIDQKIDYVNYAKSKESKIPEEVAEGIAARIMTVCSKEGGETEGVLLQKCRRKGLKDSEIMSIVMKLNNISKISVNEYTARNKKPAKKYETV